MIGVIGFVGCNKDDDETKPDPVADFSYTGGDGAAPVTVAFTNKSTNATSYSWDFGDGSSSTETSPSHTFTNTSTTVSKTRTVTLTAKNADGKSANISKTLTIEPQTAAATNTDLLTGSIWKMTAQTISPSVTINGTAVTDFYFQMDACDQDDLFKYNTNGTYVYDDGATKCNSGDPQIWEQGTWTFNIGETIINFDSGDEWNIEELTSTTFKIYYTEIWTVADGFDGLNHKATITFTAQ